MTRNVPIIGPRQLVAHFGTQAAAAKALGCTQQAISKWVVKRRIPRQWQAVAALRMGITVPAIRQRKAPLYTLSDEVVIDSTWRRGS